MPDSMLPTVPGWKLELQLAGRSLATAYTEVVETSLRTISSFLEGWSSSSMLEPLTMIWTRPSSKTGAEMRLIHDTTAKRTNFGGAAPRLLAIPKDDGNTKVPELGMLSVNRVSGKQVPSLAMTPNVLKSLRHTYASVESWDDFARLIDDQVQILRTRLEENGKAMSQLQKDRPAGPEMEIRRWKRRGMGLRLRRDKIRDELRTQEALRKTYLDIGPQGGVKQDKIRDMFKRSQLVPVGNQMVGMNFLMQQARQLSADQQSLPWPGEESDASPTASDSTNYPPIGTMNDERLKQELTNMRSYVLNRRKDPDGRSSMKMIHNNADSARKQGYVYAPSTLVGQYGFAIQAENSRANDRHIRRYKRVKKHMRDRGLHVGPVLSDDSDFDWDLKSGSKSSASDSLDRLRSKHYSRRWNRELPDSWRASSSLDKVSDHSRKTLSDLASVWMGWSTHSPKENPVTYYRTRQSMWAKLERQRTRELLEGRSRVAEPPQRRRIMHHKLTK